MKCSDPIDQASQTTELHNRVALEAHRLKAAPQQVPLPDGSWPTTDCADCGGPIESVRLAAGRIRCVGCQTALEKEESGYAKR
jgi:RNA polymerase-binding transcription factor DksA